LIATEVMRVLLLSTTPRPRVFFGWIATVIIAILFLLPLLTDQPWSERLGTAFVNLITSLAITILVSMSASAAIRSGTYRRIIRQPPSDGPVATT
jgi:hypothetical protein